jgi:hypothetical protein
MPYVTPMVNVSLSLHPSLMLLNSANKTETNMLILHKEDHGAVYTLGEENELFHAPIYTDNTVNLNEFIPVDMDSCDDEYEVLDIQNELIAASSNVRY